MRDTEIFDGRSLAAAWGLQLDPKTKKAKNASNAWGPWIDKARQLARWSPTKFVRLVAEILAEAEDDEFNRIQHQRHASN